jgi:ABC-type sugar transport system permease subunit
MNADKKRMKALRGQSLEARKAWYGRIFILPWAIGFIFFFAIPLVESFYYTFTQLNITSKGLEFQWVGFDNYLQAFTKDPDFNRNIVESVGNIVYQVPIIVFFSLFVALILKGNFKGRGLMRAIFFLPVIISSGVVITILKENVLISSTGQSGSLFQAGSLTSVLVDSGFGIAFSKIIINTIGQVFDLTWRSGVQTLLLLSALHSIPDSMYEAADIEGATGWEKFWKITFVLISPTLVLSVIYSIIDYFTDYSNKVMRMIKTFSDQGLFTYSTTISFIYFVAVMVIIMLVNNLLAKRAFYQVN